MNILKSLILLLVLINFVACHPQPKNSDVNAAAEETSVGDYHESDHVGALDGQWTLNKDVTAASGECAGEENLAATSEVITIYHFADDNTITVVGLLGDSNNMLTGFYDPVSKQISFSGTIREDDGYTTSAYVASLGNSTNSFSGNEVWSWEYSRGENNCPTGAATFTLTRF